MTDQSEGEISNDTADADWAEEVWGGFCDYMLEEEGPSELDEDEREFLLGMYYKQYMGAYKGCVLDGDLQEVELLQAIYQKFYHPLNFISLKEFGGQLSIHIEPSYESFTNILIFDPSTKLVVFQHARKAWNFKFTSVLEFAQFLREVWRIIASKLKPSRANLRDSTDEVMVTTGPVVYYGVCNSQRAWLETEKNLDLKTEDIK